MTERKGLFGLFGKKEDKEEVEKAESRAKDLAEKARTQNYDAKQADILLKQKGTMKEAAAQAVKKHVVVSGDTLSGIAKKYYDNAGKYMVIYEANNLIKPGMELVIPKQ